MVIDEIESLEVASAAAGALRLPVTHKEVTCQDLHLAGLCPGDAVMRTEIVLSRFWQFRRGVLACDIRTPFRDFEAVDVVAVESMTTSCPLPHP